MEELRSSNLKTARELSDVILGDLEISQLPISQILMKTKRLARLLHDPAVFDDLPASPRAAQSPSADGAARLHAPVPALHRPEPPQAAGASRLEMSSWKKSSSSLKRWAQNWGVSSLR